MTSEEQNRSSPPPELQSTLGPIDGVYQISCPYIAEQWEYSIPEEGFTMRLVRKDDAVWGSYNLGVWDGVFLLKQGPTAPSFDKLGFIWRGQEVETGDVDSCDGSLQFLGGGEFRGIINGLESDTEFRGRWIKDHEATATRTVAQLQTEWHKWRLETEVESEDDYSY